MTGFMHAIDVFGPPGTGIAPYADSPTRPTLTGWSRRRRLEKEMGRLAAARNKTKHRLHRLGAEWQLIDAVAVGIDMPDSFLAVGPGGVFAITVKSQGRARVLISGDTVQIKGGRPAYVQQTRDFAKALSTSFTRTAGTRIPVTPILAFSGSGLLSFYGPPKGCLVAVYRELDHLLTAYGRRIANRTVDKLASIARHPATVVDLRSDQLVASYMWHSADLTADKSASGR
jgi:hypothetical protein